MMEQEGRPVATTANLEMIDLPEVARLLLGMGASKVFVFGSAARGSLRDSSDLDIAVAGLHRPRKYVLMASLRDPLPDGQGSVDPAFYGPNRTPTVREGILRWRTVVRATHLAEPINYFSPGRGTSASTG